MSLAEHAPTMSIGMMAHNSAEFIGEAVESVLAQSRSDWELIISDDASTDNTGDVVRPYLVDGRIRYYHHAQNLGQARNWWYVIRQARAPVFARLDADDCWLPHAVADFIAQFGQDVDVVCGSWVRVGRLSPGMSSGVSYTDETLAGEEAYRRETCHNSMLQGAASVRTELLLRAGEPLSGLRYMVDYEYTLRVLARSRMVKLMSTTVLLYRVHEQNETSSAQGSLGYVAERPLLFVKCQEHAHLNPMVTPLLGGLYRRLCAEDFSDGLSEAVRRSHKTGARIMRNAIRRCPVLLLRPKVLVDLGLASLGMPGYQAMRLLHRRRVLA